MADIQKVLQTFISDAKALGNETLASKVYRDEPILITAAQLESYTPPKYLEMRKIAKSSDFYNATEARIFYAQARFMEDFEDDFDFTGEFSRYFPTYQCMSNLQLRGYFTWRTRVRRGEIAVTSLSFVFVYIYELLNLIGVDSPLNGFYILKNFWAAYREIDAKIDGYVKLWLKDYVVYHDLPRELLADFDDTSFDEAVLVLLNYVNHDEEAVFTALNNLSSYDLTHLRFYKEHAADVQKVVFMVFGALTAYYAKNRKNDIYEKFFGKVYCSAYYMFSSAVFYQRTKPDDRIYVINDIYRYRCQNGVWNCERFFSYRGKNKQIGALLKTVDFLMRQKYAYKSALKAGEITKVLHDIINREIDRHLAERKRAAAPKIEIDVSRLPQIRQAALTTQSKLIVDEEATADVSVIEAEPPLLANETGLNEVEYRFVQSLLHGGDWQALLSGEGLMLSVLVDAVNDKLFDLIGDTALTEEAGFPAVIEDYIDDLKGMVKP